MTTGVPRSRAQAGPDRQAGWRRERLRRWTGRVVFAAVAVVLAQSALFTLRDGLKGLVLETPAQRNGWGGAIDLTLRHRETHQWFAGQRVMSDSIPGGFVTYPPASYAIMWPLLGWLPVGPARGLWAATSLAALAWLGVLLIRHAGAHGPVKALVAALLPFALDGTRVCLANGQLAILLLPALVTGVLLLGRDRRDWLCDLLGAALVLAALVKPSFAAPFFLVVLISLRRIRPALLIAGGYAALTALALCFQPIAPAEIFRLWLRHSYNVLTSPVGSANLHSLLGALGLSAWSVPASLLALIALASWLSLHRTEDPWLLLGVTGTVARVWTYHSGYDDLLLLLPMVALVRTCAEAAAPAWRRRVAAILLVMTWASVTGLYWQWGLSKIPNWSDAWGIVWLGVLVFLATQPALGSASLRPPANSPAATGVVGPA